MEGTMGSERTTAESGHLANWLRLIHTPGLGPRRTARLLERFGSPDAALAVGTRGWTGLGLPETALPQGWEVQRERGVEDDLAWLGKDSRNEILTLHDPRYPALLLAIPDPPPVLYLTGDVGLLRQPQIAIIGSRAATPQGLQHARNFADTLTRNGLTITSGLAAGIDASAHVAALAAPDGRTIAVMATGPDRIYPPGHRRLAHRIADHGLLLALWPAGTGAQTTHFPQRNRVISGLALGTLVVEAAQRSGSLITARLAAEQGRSVYAIPGSVLSRVSRGCHQLIQEGAQLVQDPEDILEDLAEWLGVDSEDGKAQSGSSRGSRCAGEDSPLAPEQAEMLALMGFDPIAIDALVERSGLTVEVVSSMLVTLELNGRVAPLGLGHYQRLEAGST